MENAAKALEIAGGVLISILVLGLLIYAYNNLTSVKQTEQDATEAEQATDFNKDYEVYNKDGLYGSQIFSLANLIHNYNANESNKKGYTEIGLEVTFNGNNFSTFENDTPYREGTFENDNTNYKEITNNYEKLQTNINYYSTKKLELTSTGEIKTVAAWSKSSNNTLISKFGKIPDDVQTYKNMLQEQTDIARLTFDTPKITYDKNTGRITEMVFEQK